MSVGWHPQDQFLAVCFLQKFLFLFICTFTALKHHIITGISKREQFFGSTSKKFHFGLNENVKFVQNFKKGSTIRRAEAYKYALTSKYIFYTQAFNWIGMSRRNQLFIDLWHGCGYKANKNGRKVFFDYCLVPGDIS